MAPFVFSHNCGGGPRSRIICATYMAWGYPFLLRSSPSKRVVSLRSSQSYEHLVIGILCEFVGNPYHRPQVPNDLNIAKNSCTTVANLELAFIQMTLLGRKVLLFPLKRWADMVWCPVDSAATDKWPITNTMTAAVSVEKSVVRSHAEASFYEGYSGPNNRMHGASGTISWKSQLAAAGLWPKMQAYRCPWIPVRARIIIIALVLLRAQWSNHVVICTPLEFSLSPLGF